MRFGSVAVCSEDFNAQELAKHDEDEAYTTQRLAISVGVCARVLWPIFLSAYLIFKSRGDPPPFRWDPQGR